MKNNELAVIQLPTGDTATLTAANGAMWWEYTPDTPRGIRATVDGVNPDDHMDPILGDWTPYVEAVVLTAGATVVEIREFVTVTGPGVVY